MKKFCHINLYLKEDYAMPVPFKYAHMSGETSITTTKVLLYV